MFLFMVSVAHPSQFGFGGVQGNRPMLWEASATYHTATEDMEGSDHGERPGPGAVGHLKGQVSRRLRRASYGPKSRAMWIA